MKKTIGLLNWSGHHNIGDDVMASCIQKALEARGYKVVNQGEEPHPEGIDAYFWGGGTLISQGGIFPPLPVGIPVIGFGIGVCELPLSHFNPEQFRDIRHIFARDYYSYIWLVQHNIPATLSFDPVFLLDFPKLDLPRDFVAVNIIASQKTDYKLIKELLQRYDGEDKIGFAVGLPEDPIGCSDFHLVYDFYSDPLKLHKFLSTAKVAITTRLHAAVFAYMSGVPVIEPVVYDPKVLRFLEYVVHNKLSLSYMRERLNEHIDYALTLI